MVTLTFQIRIDFVYFCLFFFLLLLILLILINIIYSFLLFFLFFIKSTLNTRRRLHFWSNAKTTLPTLLISPRQITLPNIILTIIPTMRITNRMHIFISTIISRIGIDVITIVLITLCWRLVAYDVILLIIGVLETGCNVFVIVCLVHWGVVEDKGIGGVSSWTFLGKSWNFRDFFHKVVLIWFMLSYSVGS